MNRDQALDVLETIAELYPNYELTTRKVKLLLPQLKRMDYEAVLQNLSTYVAKSPYAPTLADLAAYPRRVEFDFEQECQWQREASQVPEETRQKFKRQMDQLLKARDVQ